MSFEIARRHRFHREMASLPDEVTAHVLPTGGGSAKDDSVLAYRDFSAVIRRIDQAYEASVGLPARTACDRLVPADRRRAGRDRADDPDLDARSRVWLLVAIVLSPVVPGRLRPLRLLSLLLMHLVLEWLMLVELFGLWIASGFGYFIRRPYFERIHYDIVQAYLFVFFREARRVARLKIVTEGAPPDAYPGRAAAGVLSARRPGGLVHADVRPDALVRPRAPGRPQGHARLGPRDRRDPQPAAQQVRLPEPRRRDGDLEDQVGELARNLDENDAFVIFPEGGNFTPQRRQRADRRSCAGSGWRRWRGAPSG